MSRSITPRRAVTLGMAASLAAAGLVSFAGGASAAAGTTGVASPAIGNGAGGTVVSIAGTGLLDANGALAVGTPKVTVAASATGAAPTCSSSAYGTATALTASSVVSSTRAIVTMPAASMSTFASLKANVCFPILATASATTPTYVAVPFTYALADSWPVSGATLAPTAGPMAGGQTVTLFAKAGSVFQPSATVLFGSTLGLTPKVAADGLSMTVVTPVISTPGNVAVTVRTPGFPDLVDSPIAAHTFTLASTLTAGTALVGTGFSASDVGATVTGGSAPAGTMIASYTDSTHVTLNTAVTINTGTITVTPRYTGYTVSRALVITPNVGLTTTTTPITVKGSGFMSGMYQGGTVTPAVRTITAGAAVGTVAVATAGTFLPEDVGATLGNGLGTVVSVTDSTHAVISPAISGSAVAAASTTVTGIARGGSLGVYLLASPLSATSDPAGQACTSVQVLSDSELTCVVPAAATAGAGQALRVLVSDSSTWTTKRDSNDSAVSRGAIFTRADF